MYIKVLTVSELNSYIKKVMDSDFILGNAYIKGEISNFKLHTSGHAYFSLKDENGKINCVMFRSDVQSLKFMPENGMKVNVKGRVSVYIKDGAYQLYASEIELEGMGELYIAFEKLKEKLSRKGIFHEEHKQSITLYPSKIGVITSKTGAAVRDIINVSRRRNKNIDIVIYPVLVQGVKASKEIIKGIDYMNNADDVDTIIIARGGGSIEELWAFNDENLAYAVYNSKKPVITGVGHETDFTIVDFVSDMRAPTPSAAAEIAVPDLSQFSDKIYTMKKRLSADACYYLESKRKDLELKKKLIENNSPEAFIVNGYSILGKLQELLFIKTKRTLEIEKEKISKYKYILASNNPQNVLNKGYSIIKDKDGEFIDTVKKLKSVNDVVITMKDGYVETSLINK